MRDLLYLLDPRQQPELAVFIGQVVARLLLAAFLGGIIGLERETKRKAAGLRTNMFICFGSAFFTILSYRLAGEFSGDHTRIAAQIIPGIGFIGAGSILHSKGGVQGLTTAATIFVVASIGMAAGGGLFLPAIFATIVLLVALHTLGWVENRFNLKPLTVTYEAQGDSADDVLAAVNGVLDGLNKRMRSVQLGRTNSHHRVIFSVDAFNNEHRLLQQRLRSEGAVTRLSSFDTEDEDQE
ncbi:MAG TPA: MgtC/SapB family protein [Clostridia bacterium]|nr:MgtC/SapB family protein [Clostridia bacterium]